MMRRILLKSILLPGIGLAACAAVASIPRPSTATDSGAGGQVDFAKDIQPILKESCVRCHEAGEGRGSPGRGPGGDRGPGPGGPPGGPGGPPGPGGGFMRGPAGGLRLDNQDAAMKGGRHGKAIIPGKADDSLLYKLLKGPVQTDDDEIHPMPKPRPRQEFKPLPDEQIALIKRWIDQGAKWTK